MRLVPATQASEPAVSEPAGGPSWYARWQVSRRAPVAVEPGAPTAWSALGDVLRARAGSDMASSACRLADSASSANTSEEVRKLAQKLGCAVNRSGEAPPLEERPRRTKALEALAHSVDRGRGLPEVGTHWSPAVLTLVGPGVRVRE